VAVVTVLLTCVVWLAAVVTASTSWFVDTSAVAPLALPYTSVAKATTGITWLAADKLVSASTS